MILRNTDKCPDPDCPGCRYEKSIAKKLFGDRTDEAWEKCKPGVTEWSQDKEDFEKFLSRDSDYTNRERKKNKEPSPIKSLTYRKLKPVGIPLYEPTEPDPASPA